MSKSFDVKKIAIGLVAAGLVSASALALQDAQMKAPAASPPAAAQLAAQAPGVPLPDIATLVERVTPAVVHITVSGRKTEGGPELPEGMEEGPMGEFFKRFGPRGGPSPEPMPSHGMGSGFIVSSDGIVVTNHHVVANAETVTVKLADRREFTAKVMGSDRYTDMAVLKIEATGLPTVKLGNSDALKVGQWVVAIGAPFGFERSATQGIVSALGRSLPGDQYVPFIQTDVAVNPGNSGGPLFDLAGQVIGINSQIYSRSGGYMGLSFAIPVNAAMNVAEQIRTTGSATRGWLGLNLQPVTQELAGSFGMAEPRGVLVSAVTKDSPAAQAGVQVGDVIVAYNGKAIVESSDLPALVGATKPGEKGSLSVVRGGKEKTLEVKIGSFPDPEAKTRLGQAESDGAKGARLNVAVSELTPEQRAQLGVEGGVRIGEVGPGAGRNAGMRPGDILLQVNGTDVKSVAQLKELTKDLPAGKPVPILVKRGNGSLFLALTIPTPRG